MKMTIYLPDDLGKRVRSVDDLNVSAVCQGALRNELAFREEAAKVDVGMEGIKLHDGERNTDVMFTGQPLVGDAGPHGVLDVYLTGRHRLALYDTARMALYTFDSFEEFRATFGEMDTESTNGMYAEMVAGVASDLGITNTVILDI